MILLDLCYPCGEVTAKGGEFTVLNAMGLHSPTSKKMLKGKKKGIKHILHVVVTEVQEQVQ